MLNLSGTVEAQSSANSDTIDVSGIRSEVRYAAEDSIRFDLHEQKVYLFGKARVTYEDIELTAERITYDFKHQLVEAHGVRSDVGEVVGRPLFIQGSHEFGSDSMRYNFRTKEGLIRNVRTTEMETYVQADLSKRHGNEEIHNKGGMLTTCDRPKPHYHFKVSRMMVIPDDKIIIGPAFMKVGKVPTPLAIPFGLFPNRQRGTAGILVPAYGNSDRLGYFFQDGGFYMPVNDHVDLQLTGDIYSRGSWAADLQSRYVTRYRFNGSLRLSHATQLNSDPEFPDFSRTRSYFVNWNHQVDPKASLRDRFSASVNVGSSNNFTNNFSSSNNDYLSNTFQSNVAWTRLWPGKPYTLGVNLRHSQNSLTRNFDVTLPSVNFNVNRMFPFEGLFGRNRTQRQWYDDIGLTYSTNFDNRLSTTEDRLSFANLPDLRRDFRNGVRHNLNLTTSFKTKVFSVNPIFRATERWYFNSLDKEYLSDLDTVITDTLPGFKRAGDWSVGVNVTSKLYGMFQFGNGDLKAIRHVITPSAGFTYRPDQSTQIEGPFGLNGALSSYSPFDIGIYGKPPAGESGSINLGLIQSLEAKVRDGKKSTEDKEETRKIKLLDFVGLGTSHDLLKDSLRWSPISLAARTTLLNIIQVNFNSSLDPFTNNELGQRIEVTEWEANDRLVRLTSANVALGLDIKSPRYGQATPNDEETVVGEPDPNKGGRVDLRIPWRLNMNYSHDLQKDFADGGEDLVRRSLLFNGDFTVLRNWKVGFSSGYDLENEEFTPSSLNLYWDLHCWEFNFNVIPNGIRQSFSFKINVKASVLKDLKFEQRRPINSGEGLLY